MAAMPRESALTNPYASGQLAKNVPWFVLGGSLLLSFMAFLLFYLAEPTAGYNLIGALVVAAIVHATIIYVLSLLAEGPRKAKDRLVTTLVTGAFLLALLPLVTLLYTVVTNGLARFDIEFFTNSMRNIVGEGGGAIHAVVGTVLMTLTATLISVPIGLMTSIYLVEYGRGPLARSITFFVDVMTGIPSIVAGLFAYSVFALAFGPGVKLGIAGAISLSVLMIPVVVRSSEDMLKLVPNELREASYALGVPKWLTVLKIVLPTSMAGITTGLNYNLVEGRMQSLPVLVYNHYVSQGTDAQADLDRAWAGALTLILIVMVLNLVARLVARYFSPRFGR